MTDTEGTADTSLIPPEVVSAEDPIPRNWRLTVAGTVGAVAFLHLLFLWGNRGPVLYQDALVYLGNARFLAGGTPPSFDGTGYYNAGYSLLLVPIYWVTEQSGIVWATAVLINVVLAVAILVPAYFLAHRLFSLPRRQALFAAAATSLTPALLLQPGRVWVETLFPVVFVTAAALVALTLESKRGIVAFGAGLATGYLVVIHGRGFAALGALALFLIAALALRELSVRLVAIAVGGAIIGIVVDRVLRSYLTAHLWTNAPSQNTNPIGIVIEALMPGHILGTATVALGHLWYVVATTFGVAIVGFVALLIVANDSWRADSKRTRMLTSLFIVLAVLGAAFISATFLGGGERSDTRVYGRYLEGFTPALVLAGVAWILLPRSAWKIGVVAAASIPVIGFLLVTVSGPDTFRGFTIKLTIPGLLGLQTIATGSGGNWLKFIEVLPMSIVAGILAILIVVAGRWKSTAGALAFVLITLAVTFVGKTTSWDPFVSSFFYGFNEVPTALRSLPEYDPVAYDRRFFLNDAHNLYEFRLAPRHLVYVDDVCDVRSGQLVISTNDPELIIDGLTPMASDWQSKQALWLVTDSAEASCRNTPAP